MTMKIRVLIKRVDAPIEEAILLGIARDEKEIWTRFVRPWCESKGIESYYVRGWIEDGYYYYDVGSWSYYVLIPLEDLDGQKQI